MQESLCPFFLGCRKEFLRLALLHNVAVCHKDYLTGRFAGKRHFMGHHDHRHMILRQLANSFAEIAEKELKNELPTDGEFELIRSYGGQLQHLWEEAMKADAEATGQALTTKAFPAAVVTDVATDPDGGVCLELGTGSVSEICVIFPIGGELHVASGTCFSFYQFSQPISDRLTDNAWREMMGLALNSSGSYNTPAKKTEDWVKDFSYNWRDYN